MTHRCPTCGDTFDSSRGLGVHHSAAHGELLPNRECACCGESFHGEYERKYCSEDCREQSTSFEGPNNPNYRGGKETATCEICGGSFRYYPSEKPGLYCSECVAEEQWRYERDISGPRNPRWDGGAVELDCDNCGTTFERQPSNIESERTFCSRDCQYEWLSDAFTGEGHPNWAGGGMANYRGDWRDVRRQALERDDRTCVACGADHEELGRNPDVHHIIPVRAYAESPNHDREEAHRLDNVVCLCPSCHRRAEFGKIERDQLRELTGPGIEQK